MTLVPSATFARARALATVGILLVTGSPAALAQQAETWSRVLATQDAEVVGNQVRTVLAAAGEISDKRVVVQVPGPPDEILVGLVAQVFEPTPRLVAAGFAAERIAVEECGQISVTYLQLLNAANAGIFTDSKFVRGKPGELVNIMVPACLKTRNVTIHRIAKGDTVAALAQPVSGREFGKEYCAELQQLNFFDVCAASQSGRLQVGTLLRLPKPRDEQKVATSFATLTASQDAVTTGTLVQEFSDKILATYQSAHVVGTSTQPLPLAPDPTPTTIVPTGQCSTSIPPFDARSLVDAIYEFKQRSKTSKINVQPKVVVGIVDTGLFDSARTSFFERVPPTKLPSGSSVFKSLIERNAGGPLTRTYPGESRNVAPDDGSYADHGTHVAGLVIGGADLWTYLATASFFDKRIPEYLSDYVPSLVPVKVMTSPGAGMPPRTDTGSIISALSYLRGEVSIVNLSYRAKYEKGLYDTFTTMKANNKVLIVAAAGNDYLTYGGLDRVAEEEMILPAMLTGPAEKLFITVGALDDSGKGKAAPFSQRSRTYVDLFAPGTCIRSFGSGQPLANDVVYSGTSQAAPLVSFAAAMLRRFDVPLEHIKERLVDTVDASEPLTKLSTSGGVLNVAKALNYLDDIVVFDKEPAGTFRRGAVVYLNDKKEEALPGAMPDMCSDSDAGDPVTLRNSRRIVVGNGAVRWSRAKVPKFEYLDCTARTDLWLRLKANDGKPDKDFVLADVKEIIPKPRWLDEGN